MAKGDCIGDAPSLGDLRLLGVLGEGEQLVNLCAELAVEFEQALVTDRTAPGVGVTFFFFFFFFFKKKKKKKKKKRR